MVHARGSQIWTDEVDALLYITLEYEGNKIKKKYHLMPLVLNGVGE